MPLTNPHLRPMLRLAAPLVAVQVGLMLMGVVDTVMVGHLSSQALAAVALGNMYFFIVAVFGMGALMVLDPVIAQAVGAGDRSAIAAAVQRGILLAAVLSLLSSGLLLLAEPALRAARQPADVIPLAATYSRLMVPGIFPFLAFIVFRQTLQALHRTKELLLAIVAANVLNVVLNWVLIFGHAGFPSLGVAGSAWATSLSRWFMVLGLLAAAWPLLRPTLTPRHPDLWRLAPLGRMLHLGIPIGAQHQLEFGAFAFVGLMMGWLGTSQMAGHQVALNLASLTFMVPLGISAAAAVLVGRAIGENDPAATRGAAKAALWCAIAFMSATAIIFLTMPRFLASLYSTDRVVLGIAATLIPIAGVFQVFDGVQVVASGVLRGAGDTRVPMLVNLLGYWLIGLPLSLYLGFRSALGPVGLWWGLVLGLVIAAVVLVWRIRIRLSGQLRRVEIDLSPAPPA